MDNLGGVYLVLVVGCSVAIAYGILEWLFFVYRKACHGKVNADFCYKCIPEYKHSKFQNLNTVDMKFKEAFSIFNSVILAKYCKLPG